MATVDEVQREFAASKILGVSVHALRKWRHLRKGPRFVRLGSRLVGYRISDLSQYLNEQSVSTENDMPVRGRRRARTAL